MTTPVAAYTDAQQIVQSIRTITNMPLSAYPLVGQQYILKTWVPIKPGLMWDVYSASFLANEKVVKEVLRIEMLDKGYVEQYAWSTYLKRHRNGPNLKEGIMCVVTDAAKGLQYLHSREPPVVHGRMRGDGILITNSGGGVLGGFGSAEAFRNSGYHETVHPDVVTGFFRWKAPELLVDEWSILSTPCDVWGWAMTVLELISGLSPYHQREHAHSAMLHIVVDKRAPVRAEYPEFENYALKLDKMWALLERCWAFEPEDRPTIDEVLVDLANMASH
ncbi:hypothetical protein FRC07_010782 [Ceratobasidium sp. 392]|nr:hypothetical protein FRC07_010782 [Ceratobasidium sp. 392]